MHQPIEWVASGQMDFSSHPDDGWLAVPTMGTFIYPATAIVTPPSADWTGSDTDGRWVSEKHKAAIMCLGHGAEWWAQMDGRWLTDPEDHGPMAFASSRMAREQVEHRRAKEQA